MPCGARCGSHWCQHGAAICGTAQLRAAARDIAESHLCRFICNYGTDSRRLQKAAETAAVCAIWICASRGLTTPHFRALRAFLRHAVASSHALTQRTPNNQLVSTMFSRLASAARAAPRRAAAVVAPRGKTAVAACRSAAPLAMRSMATAPRARTILVGEQPTIAGTFGQDSFNERAMKACLSKGVYEEITACIKDRKPVSMKLANHFAQGLMR